ncbi:hypothetical protein A2866_00955 [Candidatus Roizmanbacteria bacterium RIFCSPHIGHO2_01_FULL_39_8]|uniref:CBS domain-containing protein n=1 Tax=Candidatus Roizmanbacteria bacterium RIFCSPHIGHO2_01_FULL_39_8 TaxID=1802033 RepID=A0A1F7GIB8_9BACT|nr:MAG: hypothetical protein A2866_00955 [Candidatus Roizmanbacteria bacterium RIFCSPHIGHO2_01_FULL_39_8]
MLYFSELRNKKVYTEDLIFLGKLKDLTFLASDTPKITKLIVRNESGEDLFIPVTYTNRIDRSSIIVKKNYLQEEMVANELFILKNLLDKQIIDLRGNKVVRVNDVALQEQPFLYVAGVDIGLLGILRQLGLEIYMSRLLLSIGIRLTSQFLSWADIQPIELAYGRVLLKKEEKKLEKIKPEDLATYLERTNILNIRKFLKILDDRTAAEVVNFLNVNFQTSLFRQSRPERAAKIISLMDPDEAVDALSTLSSKKREQLLLLLDSEKRKEMQYLLRLAKTPIGSIITTEYISVDSDRSVKEVLSEIRKKTDEFSFLPYVYVTNKEQQLIGAFDLHELILEDNETPIYKFMVPNLVVAHLTSSKEIILKKMIKYRLSAIPVIDNDRHIQGIVTLDDAIQLVLPKLS